MDMNGSEEYVRKDTVKWLIEARNYKKEQIYEEFGLKMGDARKRADIVVFYGETRGQENIDIIIECKSEDTTDRSKGISQLKSYMACCLNCSWGIWTNGKDKIIYEKVRLPEGRLVLEEVGELPLKFALETTPPILPPKIEKILPPVFEKPIEEIRVEKRIELIQPKREQQTEQKPSPSWVQEEEVLLALSKQMDVPVEELKKELEEILLEVKKDERLTNATDADIRTIAINRLSVNKRYELASPANTWKGIILGVGNLVDTVQKVRRLSEEAYALDPVKASNGYVYKDVLITARAGTSILHPENGVDRGVLFKMTPDNKVTTTIIPLYPKTEANDKYRRSMTPIPEHSWLRYIYGFAAPVNKKTSEMGESRLFLMALNGNLAIEEEKIPRLQPVSFKGINKTDAETAKDMYYKINASTHTEFNVDSTLALPPPKDTRYIKRLIVTAIKEGIRPENLRITGVVPEKQYATYFGANTRETV